MNHVFWNTGAILETLEKNIISLITVPILEIASKLVRNVLEPPVLK